MCAPILPQQPTPFDRIPDPIVKMVAQYFSQDDISNFFTASKGLAQRANNFWILFINKADRLPPSQFVFNHFLRQGLKGLPAWKAAGKTLVIASRLAKEIGSGNMARLDFIDSFTAKLYSRDANLFLSLPNTLPDLKDLSSFSDEVSWFSLAIYAIATENDALLREINFDNIYLGELNNRFLLRLSSCFQNDIAFEKINKIKSITNLSSLLYAALSSECKLKPSGLNAWISTKIQESLDDRYDYPVLKDLFKNGISLNAPYPFPKEFVCALLFFQLIPQNTGNEQAFLSDPDLDKDMLLSAACRANRSQWVKFLLERFPDAFSVNHNHHLGEYGCGLSIGLLPSLLLAANCGYEDVVRALAFFPRMTKAVLQYALNKVKLTGSSPDRPNLRAEREDHMRARAEIPFKSLKEIKEILQTAIDLHKEPLLAAPLEEEQAAPL